MSVSSVPIHVDDDTHIFWKEDVEILMKPSYNPYLIMYSKGDVNKVWTDAFRVYNENHSKKLGMSCTPCYFKVAQYILNQYQYTYKDTYYKDGNKH